MAVANIYVYCGEGGWSVDDVNPYPNLFLKDVHGNPMKVYHFAVLLHLLTNRQTHFIDKSRSNLGTLSLKVFGILHTVIKQVQKICMMRTKSLS